MHRVDRARPLMGTLVSMRAWSADETAAQAALDEAFREVDAIHRLMSFHDADSDVSRLNAMAHARAVRVDARTHAVLRRARELHAASAGCFDVGIAPLLVRDGCLPAPSAAAADSAAGAQDIELLDDHRVRFRRKLWIDLGGIAKGYAVDRAVCVLRSHGIRAGSVNAGGDLRVFGARPERVLLRSPKPPGEGLPVMDVRNHALATSSSGDGVHWHGSRRRRARAGLTVVVAARRAWLADALTKVALCDPRLMVACLAHYNARAYVQRAHQGFRELQGA